MQQVVIDFKKRQIPNLSVIIPSHNDKEFLEKCLTSLYKDNAKTHEIIVVDDFSSDGTSEMVIKHFPDIKIIRNTIKTSGIGRARNRGIKTSRGKYILFMDADTEIQNGTLDKLFKYMEQNLEVAIAGPKLIYPDGSLQYSCRTFPNPITFIFRGLGVGENTRIMNDHLMKNFDHNSQKEVESILGACLIIRRRALESIGIFDEKYFFGYEDTDLCLRARKGGWKTAYVPDAVVKHHYRRRSSNGGLFNRWKWAHIKGGLRFFSKRYIFYRLI
jgi:N-acetylglucosaminyl-diphospho-decaprenol L-rhamnosyltransferase